MATATTAHTRRKAKRVVRHARAKATPRKVHAAVNGRANWRVVSMVATGAVIVLGAAALAAAAFDPRVARMARIGYRDMRDAVDDLDLPSHMPDVSIPGTLDILTRQFTEAGHRLSGLFRAAANRF